MNEDTLSREVLRYKKQQEDDFFKLRDYSGLEPGNFTLRMGATFKGPFVPPTRRQRLRSWLSGHVYVWRYVISDWIKP